MPPLRHSARWQGTWRRTSPLSVSRKQIASPGNADGYLSLWDRCARNAKVFCQHAKKKGGVAKHFLERNLFYEITLCLHKRVFLRFARVLGGTQRWSRLVAQKNDGMVQKDAIKGGTP